MARTDRTGIWPLIHAERAALAADLADLDEDAWRTPSLCAGLTVREVLAHLTAGASLNGIRWLAGVVRCRFDFDKQVRMRLDEQLGSSGADTLARFDAVRGGTTTPPLPRQAILGETIVHGSDIRRPLGLVRTFPTDTLVTLARYYAGTDQVVVAKGRIGGLHLRADDSEFEAGSGAPVIGSTLALIMAMTGRADYCVELTGEGAAVLAERAVRS
ncbi:maleylpyruvate isomerase family mycothiol-dependent enzyme [Occultella aeris]|uniref:Mycothiol-dependent maleylpyruvate isomerase metal-binding domain-containing protein n=1 Tax=Occultella aeris TaxID=2761496 RepID=A0A7M4DS07_9MICO|nr:maleylpyruvate isomerase family mycothiol-dependent enzyme [Occultella aeris]VZO40251.1 hypothetical protein HALOF300_04954 [Occultella aeris]